MVLSNDVLDGGKRADARHEQSEDDEEKVISDAPIQETHAVVRIPAREIV